MAIIDLFSNRQRRLSGDYPEVFQDDSIPQALRNQILHIIDDGTAAQADTLYKNVHRVLCRKYGRTYLGSSSVEPLDLKYFFLKYLKSGSGRRYHDEATGIRP
jgi:hypothetical protein